MGLSTVSLSCLWSEHAQLLQCLLVGKRLQNRVIYK